MARLKSIMKPGSASRALKKKSQRRPRKRQPSQLAFTTNHRASTASSMLQSLLTLYGLVALMHGVVIPISDALAKPVEHAAYRQMFYIFMHGVGICCLVYLNWLISWHQRRAKRRAASTATAAMMANSGFCCRHGRTRAADATLEIPMEQLDEHGKAMLEAADGEANNDHRADSSHDDPAVGIVAEALPDTQASDSAADVHDVSGEVGEQEGQTEGGVDRQQQQQQQQHQRRSRLRGIRRRRNPLAVDLPPLLVNREAGEVERAAVMDTPDSPLTPNVYFVSPITLSETGINLYLRLGAIVFGFGVMIHDGFKLSEVLERNDMRECHDMWFIPKHVVHLLFIMVQTYYLFKHHRIAFNTQLPLIRFMMVHLMVTNLCIWVKTVIYEIKVGLGADYHGRQRAQEANASLYNTAVVYLQDIGGGNESEYNNKTAGCLERLLKEGPSHHLGPYLYPCAVEYGLICAAICFKVFGKIGDTKVTPYGRKMYPEGPRFTACHKSHKGLFLGLFIMICVLVPMISLQLLKSVDKNQRGMYMLVVLGVECSVLFFTSAMCILGTAKTIRHLKLYRVHGNEAFDVNLLFVGLAGVMCYNLFVSISVGSCAVDSNVSGHCPQWTGYRNLITKVAGVKAVLEVLQSVAQTLFIMQSIQRRITLQLVNRNHKPGRGITIGLLIANLAMWIEAVFEAKRSFAEDFPQEYFGAMAWSIVKYLFLPLIIFYRFHSTVCLSEIWIRSYKMPKKRAVE